MDFLSLEPDRSNTKDILVITDHFTKYAVAIPTRNQKAQTVAKCLWDNFLVTFLCTQSSQKAEMALSEPCTVTCYAVDSYLWLTPMDQLRKKLFIGLGHEETLALKVLKNLRSRVPILISRRTQFITTYTEGHWILRLESYRAQDQCNQ
ncbi:hypothetical protein AAFF_G00017700 [Aldrovandia affinis]|uniref:Uncharacterized protein n=1 Tax=Aldrovandia affinis TaxID=143900 RepID=A0AAD7WHQ5_9TELE|nr:hypothetical protein AAFF_G00017700 [Aldrovandia affinis]